jgi:hypothetical protein
MTNTKSMTARAAVAVLVTACSVTSRTEPAGEGLVSYGAEDRRPMRMGMNLTAVNDSTTAPPFVDLFRMARPWLTRSVGGKEWDSGKASAVALDAAGWPKAIPATVDGVAQIVHTLVPFYESGTYRIRTKGRGEIAISNGTSLELIAAGGTTERSFDVAFAGDRRFANFLLQVRRSDPSDPIREIEIYPPGFGPESPKFHPAFKRSLEGYAVLRFMDWQRTNEAGGKAWAGFGPLERWSQRTTPASMTQGGPYGVAYELQLDLAIEVGVDPWINVPHPADDDFVRNLARLVRDRLPAGRKVYVEYTNEHWNGIFAVGSWLDANVAGEDRFARYGARARRIFEIFGEEFAADVSKGAPRERLVRVLAGQAVNDHILRRALSTSADLVDAIAIAPYFGKVFGPAAELPTTDDLAREPLLGFEEVTRGVRAHAVLARETGKRLIAYEGGQHYVGFLGRENDDEMTRLLVGFNRSATMRDLYGRYFEILDREGIELFANFAGIAEPSKWGSWGVREYLTQPVGPGDGEARKEWATREWMRRHP